MRRWISAFLVTIALAASGVPALAAESLDIDQGRGHVIDESGTTEFLVVLSGAAGSWSGDSVSLEGVPAVTYFSERPDRIAGHMSVEEFVESWADGPDSYAVDPPNAVLSVLDADDRDDVVIELLGVRSDGDAVEFSVEVLAGTPPEGVFGPASIFIDDTHMKTPGVY